MDGKNSVNNRCRIAKHFRPKWNRSCAYFIGTSSHCVFSNTIQNELAAYGVSGPVLGLALDYLTGHYHIGKDIHEVRPLNGLKSDAIEDNMSTKHALRCPVTKLTIDQLQYLACNLLDHITYEGQITIKGVNAICGTNWLSDQMRKSLIWSSRLQARAGAGKSYVVRHLIANSRYVATIKSRARTQSTQQWSGKPKRIGQDDSSQARDHRPYERKKGLSRQESPDSAGRLSQCFIGEIMNESNNVLSLQVARERACQAKAASDRQISKRSNRRLLERLEAENAQLRDCVGELMLEIQALHDGTK
jgi:hypothetical protein